VSLARRCTSEKRHPQFYHTTTIIENDHENSNQQKLQVLVVLLQIRIKNYSNFR
jgi:hypothetical protein